MDFRLWQWAFHSATIRSRIPRKGWALASPQLRWQVAYDKP